MHSHSSLCQTAFFALLISSVGPRSVVAKTQVDTKPVIDRDVASVVETAAIIKGYFVDEISDKTLWDAAVEAMMKAADPGRTRMSTDFLREFGVKIRAA